MLAAVEVWTARPERLGCGACAEFMKVLDEGERDRAQRLRCETDRQAFVVAHAMRRIALALALSADPRELQFTSGPHGQPLLEGHAPDAPSFSLSRSRGLVAFALGVGGPVGIDVEAVRDGVDGSLLQPYMALSPDQPLRGEQDFYVQWTGLEAYWKARGLGLSTAHPRIQLASIGEECWDVVMADGGRSTGMTVMRLPCDPTHVLSLACAAVPKVRMVELDALAGAPQAVATPAWSGGCDTTEGCRVAAPDTFNA